MADKMELIITKPTEFLESIDFNYEELKNEIIKRLNIYQGLTYNEAEIKNAKNDRAGLNKFKTLLDDKRKEIKSKCLEPFNRFEIKVKDLIGLVDKPISEIDNQIKTFETNAKIEKQKLIAITYEENIGELKELLPFDKIFDIRWCNSTVTLKSANAELISIIEKVKNDMAIINTLDSEFLLQIKDTYLTTLDVSKALAEKARLEDQKKKIDKIEKPIEKVVDLLISDEKKSEIQNADWANISEKPKETSIKITCNNAQLQLLKVFLDMHKIKFEVI